MVPFHTFHSIPSIPYGFLLVFYSNFVSKTHHFTHSTCNYTVTLKPGLGSLKVIETDTYRYATYDFLLTLHSNHRPISYRFRDKRRFQSKMAKFSHPSVFCAPADGVRLGIGYRRTESKELDHSSSYQRVEKVLR